MKRFLCVLLVALALVGLMTTVASAEEYAMVTSENGYGVRMREGSSAAPNGRRFAWAKPLAG